MPNVARFDAGTLKLQRMIKWDVLGGTRCRWLYQWKDVDRPTFTRICKSAINWQQFFWDTDTLLMTDYLHPGKTTAGQYYAEPTLKLLDIIKQKQGWKFSLSSLSFHDNAPAHKSRVAQQALCDGEFVQLHHPACSLDLAASNYFLVRNLKYHLRGTWFIVSK